MINYERGDLVVVEGFRHRRAVLRVWADKGKGATLCTDAGYQRLLSGAQDVALVGFPKADIKGRAEGDY